MSQAVAPLVAAYCGEAGMDPKDPLRLALTTTVEAAAEAKGAAAEVLTALQQMGARLGKEAARQAGQATGQEIRAVAPRLLRRYVWQAALGAAGLVVVSAGAGWFAARRVPMATLYGRMTPAQAETMRWNDLGAALGGCTAQAPQNGREWCQIGWWLSPPAQPK